MLCWWNFFPSAMSYVLVLWLSVWNVLVLLALFLVCKTCSIWGSRAQTTVWWRSGHRSTGVFTPRCGATPPRSRTWPWTTRILWSRPAAATRPSACGAFGPAPLWLCFRGTPAPLPRYRYVSPGVGGVCVCVWKAGLSRTWCHFLNPLPISFSHSSPILLSLAWLIKPKEPWRNSVLYA